MTKLLEEAQQRFLGAILPDPEESLAAVIDLVDQRQKLGAFLLPADFVDADGGYVVQVTVGKPQATANFTERKTLSHLVWNASAVSFQESRFAHLARNQA